MKPLLNLRNVRPLSRNPVSHPTSSSCLPYSHRHRWPCTALTVAGLTIAGYHAAAQAPTPIPNWTTQEPGTTTGQYAPNQYPQQQPPQYGQPPAYGQQYGQPQYQQAPPSYGQGYGEQEAFGGPDNAYNPPYQPSRALSPDQLEQMVAPIALYPDNLLSMILAASTYPAEVSAADQWLHLQGGASPEQIAAGANAQTSWDPSVKALTAFPQVLDELAQNLQWTTDLGNAYYNQPQDVMQTVQVMRSRAQAAGNLQTTPQQVITEDQGQIEIAPPTPEVVYVPTYDPWAVYGQPVDPYPSFNWVGAVGTVIGDALIGWGPGIALQAFAVTPFGWLGWGLDWFAHAIFFDNDVWCTHSYSVHDWGFAHGGGRYWGAHGEMARFRERGGWGGRNGLQQHAFRSGLDRRGTWGGNGHPTPRAFSGNGNQAFGDRGNQGPGRRLQNGGSAWSRGNYGQNGRGTGFGYGFNGGNGRNSEFGRNGGYGRNPSYGNNGNIGPNGQYGRSYGGYGQQAYNHEPQPIGRPQQFNGARSFEGRSPSYAYRGGQQFANHMPSYGGYGRFGSSPSYGRTLQGYGGRQAYGGSSQQYRSPIYGGGSRPNSYGGSNNYARGSLGSGGSHWFGGGHSNSYGGGSFKAPRPSSGWGGGHSWGEGGGYATPKAPHFSGGGSHSWGGGGHFGGGGGHFGGGGGHFGGGGGHFGGGHSGGGHSGGGHSGGRHH